MEIEIESYSVIYSIDGEKEFVEANEPTNTELWKETENGKSDYLEEWYHKKFIALLTEDQFKEFTDNMGLYAEDVRTMGSLGAPGYGFGWSPAISFNGEDSEGIQNAYVTPNIPISETEKLEIHYKGDHDLIWETVRNQLLNQYSW